MPKYRKDRINDAVSKEIAEIIRDVKDPRIADAFLTISSADVTADLKYAKVYYSFLGQGDEKEISKGLKSASPYIRRELAHRLNLRQTPELSFIKDSGVEHGAHIAEILKEISEKGSSDKSTEKEDDV